MGIVIAIDGPAGSGKSSTAKEVARELDFTYIDTGAMYRAVTYQMIQDNVDIKNSDAMTELANSIDVSFKWKNGKHQTYARGVNISRDIRSSEVAQMVSPVAAVPEVREVLAESQRRMGKKENIVMEGRDIGTNVFPNAEFKFFLTADVEVRAKRRINDYRDIGQDLTFEQIVEELKKRDKIDSSRSHSPLKKADDAVVIETTHLDFQQQVKKITDYVREHRSENE